MASLIDGRIIVTTAAGVRISGGKLRVYNTGTTTLSTLYSDAALTVPLTNPVVADSSGVLAQIFAADGLVVDCAMLDASNVAISDRAFVMTFTGSTGTTITRDFTNSRFQVRGSGGVVYIEAGDPLGDDVGGKIRLGGWNGTQADTATVDAAATDLTGSLTVLSGKKLPGVVLTDKTAFSLASTVDIALPATPTGVRAWRVELFDVVCSAGSGNARVRLGYAGGAVKTGASDYINSGGSAASFGLIGTLLGVAAMPLDIDIIIRTPASGTGPTIVRGQAVGLATAGPNVPGLSDFVIYGLNDYGKASTAQIYYSSGTLTGSYRVIAEYGFGE